MKHYFLFFQACYILQSQLQPVHFRGSGDIMLHKIPTNKIEVNNELQLGTQCCILLFMRKSPSQVRQEQGELRPNFYASKSARQQEFQTESSVYEHYHKVHTKEDVYRSKIKGLEKKLLQTLAIYQLKINEERISLNLLTGKHEQLVKDQARDIISWKNSIQQTQSTLQYFLSRLKDYHLLQLAEIQSKYHSVLQDLHQRIRSLTNSRSCLARRLQQQTVALKELKADQRDWVKQNMKSLQNIAVIQQTISKTCADFRLAIKQQEAKQERQYAQAKVYIEQLKDLLMHCLTEEKVKRQTNKEEILELFEKLLLRKYFSGG